MRELTDDEIDRVGRGSYLYAAPKTPSEVTVKTEAETRAQTRASRRERPPSFRLFASPRKPRQLAPA